MTANALVGRDAELATLGAFLEAAEGGARALVLSGPPGIGKTVIWEHGLARAAAAGHRVLISRAAEAESDLAFTALSDLLSPVLDDVLPRLAAPRQRALSVALLLEEPGAVAPSSGAIGLAVMDCLRELARGTRVLLALDDVQWLDSATASALALALRRLGGDDVATLATLRDAPRTTAPFDLDRTFDRLERSALGPLALSDLHRLLADRLALALPRPALQRVLETSGGNPFFALEIGREYARTRDPTSVPDSLRAAVGGRLARLPSTSGAVLLAAAAAARPTVTSVVATAELPRTRSLDALAAAAREGVVTLDQDRVRFTHPLLASLCYEQAPPWQRQAVHARLAAIVDDVEERARHLALATEDLDAGVAAELRAAADHAGSRGATAHAASLAELAAARAPTDDDRRRAQIAASGFHHLAGDFGRATTLLAAIAAEMPAGAERADVLHAQARIGRDSIPTRVQLAEQALREAAGDDARCASILGILAINRWFMGDVRAGLLDARDGLVRAERAGDPRVLAAAIARAGLLETWAADLTPGLFERGIEIERGLSEPLLFIESPTFTHTSWLIDNDELERARLVLQRLERDAVQRGDEHTRQFTVLQFLIADFFEGRLAAGVQRAAEARAIAEQTHEPQYRGMIEHYASFVEADFGRLDRARTSAADGLRYATSVGDEIHAVGCLAALGHLELLRGDAAAAADVLRELPARIAATGHRSANQSHSADTIEALVAVGELDRARLYLDEFLQNAPRMNAWARIGASRCAGLLAAAHGDRNRAIETMERALASDAHRLYPFERARTLLAMGRIKRQERQRREARDAIERAVTIFEMLQATPWVEKARSELARISGRRSSPSELTDAELRIAELAAQGRHNREIAAELFVSVGTVERHLTRVYRKLGVRSRTELTRGLSDR